MRAWILAGMVLLAGCSNMSRTASYGTGWADAIYGVYGKRIEMYAHERDSTLLLQVSLGRAIGQGFIQAATLGLADDGPSFATWKAAAEWIVEPVGCEVVELKPLMQATTWEVRYRCPAGTDLRAMITAQREQLRRGIPLARTVPERPTP